ncbi:MAG: TetR/AcrR family transcriptional regulator [Roseiflexaceae bacterium]
MTPASSNRKDQILQAAEKLFSQRGYHATTMREIARELQIEGGSLYTHIAGKHDLLYAIVLRGSQQFLSAAREVTAAGGSPREQLRALMRRHMAIVASSVEGAVVYFHEWRHLDAPQQTEITRHRDEYEGYLRRIIRAGVDSGEFAPTDERLISLQVLALLNWTYQWFRPEGPLSAQEVADRFFEQVMCGLEPRT